MRSFRQFLYEAEATNISRSRPVTLDRATTPEYLAHTRLVQKLVPDSIPNPVVDYLGRKRYPPHKFVKVGLFRGLPDFRTNGEPYLEVTPRVRGGNTSTGIGYYNFFIDRNPLIRAKYPQAPPRESSIILSTDSTDAETYGYPYYVIPQVDAVIAVSTVSDLFALPLRVFSSSEAFAAISAYGLNSRIKVHMRREITYSTNLQSYDKFEQDVVKPMMQWTPRQLFLEGSYETLSPAQQAAADFVADFFYRMGNGDEKHKFAVEYFTSNDAGRQQADTSLVNLLHQAFAVSYDKHVKLMSYKDAINSSNKSPIRHSNIAAGSGRECWTHVPCLLIRDITTLNSDLTHER